MTEVKNKGISNITSIKKELSNWARHRSEYFSDFRFDADVITFMTKAMHVPANYAHNYYK